MSWRLDLSYLYLSLTCITSLTYLVCNVFTNSSQATEHHFFPSFYRSKKFYAQVLELKFTHLKSEHSRPNGYREMAGQRGKKGSGVEGGSERLGSPSCMFSTWFWLVGGDQHHHQGKACSCQLIKNICDSHSLRFSVILENWQSSILAPLTWCGGGGIP